MKNLDERLVQDFFDQQAPVYDTTYSGPIERAEDAALSWLLRRAGLAEPQWIADLGCGTGLFLRLCPAHQGSPPYVGVDLSQKMIDRARAEFPDNRFRRAGMEAWAMGAVPGLLDGVVSLWCAANYVHPSVMAGIIRHLLPSGGRFFIMALCPGERPKVHTPALDVLLYDYSSFPGMLMKDFRVQRRPFARELRLPWRLGVVAELLGTLTTRGQYRYEIFSGYRL